MTRQYIGARYVPKFFENETTGDSSWLAGVSYEALTIVTYNGNSYTSKKPVPSSVGAPNTNSEYWVETGNYNAQIEEVQENINVVNENIEKVNDKINQLFKNFKSARQFRVLGNNTYNWQSVCYTGTYFILFYEDINTEEIHAVTVSKTGSVVSNTNLSITGHPNGCAYLNGYIYILNTTDNKVYKYNTSFSLISSYELNNFDNYTGICSYNGKLYLYAGHGIYTFDNGTITLVCEIDTNQAITPPYDLDFQSFFIYDNLAYICNNRVNQFSVYSLNNGKLYGYYTIGDGNELFPYGELQGGVIVDDNVWILTSCYFRTQNMYSPFVAEMFATNIGKYDVAEQVIVNNVTPPETIIKVDASATGNNPDGRAINAFKSLAEASMFYNYNNAINNYYIGIDIESGSYTGDILKLVNCNAIVYGEYPTTLDYIDLYCVNGSIKDVTLTNETTKSIMHSCNMKFTNVDGDNTITVNSSKIGMDKSNGIKLELFDSTLFGINRNVVTSNSDSIWTNELIKMSDATISLASPTRAITFDNSTKAIINTLNATRFYFNLTTGDDEADCTIVLSAGDITSLYNNETVTKTKHILIYKGSTYYDMTIQFAFTKNGVTLTCLDQIILTTGVQDNFTAYVNAYSLNVV